MQKIEIKPGLAYYPEAITRDGQEKLLQDIRSVISQAPLYTSMMPQSGKPMSVQSTNCGALGWYSDRVGGYRYQANHPFTQKNWPALPPCLFALWEKYADYPDPADCGLINYYNKDAKMGLHSDQDERDFSAPVVSISLGDQANFIIGGLTRRNRTSSLKLSSGDIIVMGGKMRRIFHGISRLYPASSTLLEEGGRFNITLRKAGE